jgi:hypothetical protein
LFHDVCALSELLLAERDWDAAIDAFAERRSRRRGPEGVVADVAARRHYFGEATA